MKLSFEFKYRKHPMFPSSCSCLFTFLSSTIFPLQPCQNCCVFCGNLHSLIAIRRDNCLTLSCFGKASGIFLKPIFLCIQTSLKSLFRIWKRFNYFTFRSNNWKGADCGIYICFIITVVRCAIWTLWYAISAFSRVKQLKSELTIQMHCFEKI